MITADNFVILISKCNGLLIMPASGIEDSLSARAGTMALIRVIEVVAVISFGLVIENDFFLL